MLIDALSAGLSRNPHALTAMDVEGSESAARHARTDGRTDVRSCRLGGSQRQDRCGPGQTGTITLARQKEDEEAREKKGAWKLP